MRARVPLKICAWFRAVVVLSLLALPGVARATTVTLAWDSNRESDLAGYTILYGTEPGQPSSAVDVGNHTSYQFTNLEIGQTYYFAVQAYSRSGAMSPPSAEVSATIGTATLSLTNLMVNLAAPQPVGASMVFAAAASGGKAPYQYKWLVSEGAGFAVARDWSPDNTFTWRPTAARSYTIKSWARSMGNKTDGPEGGTAERSLPFTIGSSLFGTPTVINLFSDRQAPQSAGTPITFTAEATGGNAVYEFQYSVFDGAVWRVTRDWSGSSTWSWTPGAANPAYQVMVRIRGGRNAAITTPFPIQ